MPLIAPACAIGHESFYHRYFLTGKVAASFPAFSSPVSLSLLITCIYSVIEHDSRRAKDNVFRG